jgi:hypothetical protein
MARTRDQGMITRTVDLAGETGVELSFAWAKLGLSGTGENVLAEVSDDGGSTWNQIASLDGSATDYAWTVETIDLSAATAYSLVDGFQIRFRVDGGDKDDIGYYDEVIITSGSGGSTQLLSENFDDGDYAGWTQYDTGSAGNWDASNGYLTVNNRPSTWLYWDDSAATSWSDYTASADIRVSDNDPAAIMFYYQDENNYYRAEISQNNSSSDTSDDYIKLFRVSGGTETELDSALNPLPQGNTYGLRVSVNSSGDITVEFDDGTGYADAFGGPVNDTTFTQGTVGLYSHYHNNLRFDDVIVTEN